MPRFTCDRCGDTIPPYAHYVVKMTVYADPAMPATTADDLQETDYDGRIADLIREASRMTAQQLADSVHWEREFKVCRPCQLRLIADPLGNLEPGDSGKA